MRQDIQVILSKMMCVLDRLIEHNIQIQITLDSIRR